MASINKMKNTPIKIKALTLDLDDTLWPIWPAIRRAEEHLHQWMKQEAPATAAATTVDGLRVIRERIEVERPEHKHDLSYYRREAIRASLKDSGEDESLAEVGFDVFFEHRQNVDLFEDVLPALNILSAHYPIVGITNGNANLKKIGLDHLFKGSITAQKFGVGKPDPEIFLEAARLLDLKNTAEILHIGDDFVLDVMGAQQVGFQTAWVKRPCLNIPDVAPKELERVDFLVTDLLELCKQLGVKG